MKTAQEKLQRHADKQREYQQRAIARQREKQSDPEWRQAQYDKQRERQSRVNQVALSLVHSRREIFPDRTQRAVAGFET